MAEKFTFDGKEIGFISDTKTRLTAFKKTNPNNPKEECVFRMYDSLGFEEQILNKLLELGIDEIIIILRNEKAGTEEYFKTTTSDWKTSPKQYFNSDTGLQKHIPLDSLRKITKERTKNAITC